MFVTVADSEPVHAWLGPSPLLACRSKEPPCTDTCAMVTWSVKVACVVISPTLARAPTVSSESVMRPMPLLVIRFIMMVLLVGVSLRCVELEVQRAGGPVGGAGRA